MSDSSQFNIETATIDDLAEIYSIECDAHISPWSESMLKASLKGEHHCWKLSLESQIIAFLIVMKTLDELELLDIVVAPLSQGLGAGAKLIRHLKQFAENNHIKNTFLEVRESNAAAIHLYQKYGFKQVGIRKNYYLCEQGRENALVMQLSH